MLLLVLATMSLPAAAEPVTCWQPWSATVRAARDAAEPLQAGPVQVTYRGPDGLTYAGRAAWDGGTNWRLGTAFERAGTWQWTITCADTTLGLDGQTGTVSVSEAEVGPALYRRGFLRVSDSRRTLAFADGTPFFWLGDTAWAAPLKATGDDWREYCARRVAQGFTVTQIGCASEWAAKTDAAGHPPFDGEGLGHPNLDYWRGFERKIRIANEAGLVVLVVGLMEPVSRYPEPAAAVPFAKWLATRLDGLFVIFSPSFDSPAMELANAVGAAIDEVAPRHLITQHPGTPAGKPTPIWSEEYADRDYLDFYGVQTGHNGGRVNLVLRQARTWNLAMYRRQRIKPVINLEAMYEGGGERSWRAEDARKAGWLSLLSGAAGYTYGAGESNRKVPGGNGGLYAWCTDPQEDDFWRKVLDWPGGAQMQLLAGFFGDQPWWELIPAPERLVDEPEDPLAQAALAVAPEAGLLIAFLPQSRPVTLDVRGLTPLPPAQWFSPTTGERQPAEARGGDARVSFVPPGDGDWALQLGPR